MLCSVANAHTPFIRPLDFHPDTSTLYAEAAYSTDILLPVVGMPTQSFELLAPDGQSMPIQRTEVESYLTTIEAVLSRPGTYRLSSGELYGEPTRMVFDRGRWRAVRAGERLRRRARTSSMRIVALAETYVTRGAPTRGAVDVTVGRLAIHPISHPTQIAVASGFDVELLFDGAPFAHMPFVLYEPTQSEDDMGRVFVTDDHGRAHLSFDHPGVYLAVVRYRPTAPRDAGVAVLSYSTSLTFQVSPAPPSRGS
jgi:hypothetical protein